MSQQTLCMEKSLIFSILNVHCFNWIQHNKYTSTAGYVLVHIIIIFFIDLLFLGKKCKYLLNHEAFNFIHQKWHQYLESFNSPNKTGSTRKELEGALDGMCSPRCETLSLPYPYPYLNDFSPCKKQSIQIITKQNKRNKQTKNKNKTKETNKTQNKTT